MSLGVSSIQIKPSGKLHIVDVGNTHNTHKSGGPLEIPPVEPTTY